MNTDGLGPINAGTILIQVVFIMVTAVFLVGIFARRADDPREVTTWAAAHGLRLTEHNRAMVTWFVRLNLVLRVIGGVAGMLLGALFDGAFGLHSSAAAGFWVWIIMGWLAGGAWAERRLVRPGAAGGTASLLPRRVSDYLPIGLQLAPLASAAFVVVIAAIGTQLTWPANPQFTPPSDASLMAPAACAVAIAVLVVALLRSVVACRQPVMHPDVIAADDAIRASTAHHLGGGGSAAVLLIATHVTYAVLTPFQLPFGVRGWVPALLALGAFFSWRYFAYRAWRVRRPVARVRVAVYR